MELMKPQVNDYFCGPASMQYAIKKLFGEEISQYHIADVMNLTSDGADDEQMVKVAQYFGLFARIIDGFDVIDYLGRKNNVIIVGWTYPPDMDHYAILQEINIDTHMVTISDQWDGMPMLLTLKADDFARLWHKCGFTAVIVWRE